MPKITKSAFLIQNPDRFKPNGDRYLVEEIEVENAVYSGGTKIILAQTAADGVEIDRGWKLARIIAKGNGHRLESDITVPMFFDVGAVVYIERLCGRAIRLQASNYLIINQIDVLGAPEDLGDLMALPEIAAA